MNRQQRRALSKTNLSEIRAAENRIKKDQERVLNDGRAEAMFLISILVLHRDFKFGQQRCFSFMQKLDEFMEEWRNGLDLESLRRQVEEELGIKVEM